MFKQRVGLAKTSPSKSLQKATSNLLLLPLLLLAALSPSPTPPLLRMIVVERCGIVVGRWAPAGAQTAGRCFRFSRRLVGEAGSSCGGGYCRYSSYWTSLQVLSLSCDRWGIVEGVESCRCPSCWTLQVLTSSRYWCRIDLQGFTWLEGCILFGSYVNSVPRVGWTMCMLLV